MVLDGNNFPKEKDGFGHENKFFPRKKMVLDRKTNFFLGKRWFWAEKTNFFLGKTKKTIFWETMRPNSKRWLFWFSLGKSWFFCPKPFFS